MLSRLMPQVCVNNADPDAEIEEEGGNFDHKFWKIDIHAALEKKSWPTKDYKLIW